MLIIANVLMFNGGTTFLLRISKMLYEKGINVGILVLFDNVDRVIADELSKYAQIYYLKNYIPRVFSKTTRSPITCFLPVNFFEIRQLVKKYNQNVHIMGIFGILFTYRYLQKTQDVISASIGVYHQNEFMFNGANYYFVKAFRSIFVNFKSSALVFFNEHCLAFYSIFFENDYKNSALLPIGIDLTNTTNVFKGLFSSNKIVSIGNLHEFKTYNKHIIVIFPELLKIRPDLVYEIYGEGPMKRELKSLVKKMNLENKIFFKGMIAYEKLGLALENSFLFVGSGTAIIEAASLGVPSIVGIESSLEANTYGYLSETSGFTYNEYDKSKTQYTILSKIEEVLESEEKWTKFSIECKKRAKDFSLDKTTQGFVGLINNENNKISIKDFDNYSNMKFFCSFLWCALMSVFKIDQTFQKRKDQGTLLTSSVRP